MRFDVALVHLLRLVALFDNDICLLEARIDHAAGAQKAGKTLAPTELVIFGNPKVGTPLMQCSHSIAIDLPQKALIWQDAAGKVWFSYNDPQYLALRHNTQGCDEVLKKVAMALGNFSKKATAAE